MGFGKAFVAVVGTSYLTYAAVNHFVLNDDSAEQPEVQNAASVVRVIDGDTIDVNKDGVQIRVRLLNIDTPEIGRDGKPTECLAEDAKDYLEKLLPRGTTVSLEYDEVTKDKYGRDLAGVFKEGLFINEEIAARGLAEAQSYPGNERFYPQIRDAAEQADRKALGIFNVPAECFILDPQARQDFQTAKEATKEEISFSDPSEADIELAEEYLRKLPDVRSKLHHAIGVDYLSQYFTNADPDRFEEEVDKIETALEDREREFTQAVDDYREKQLEEEREEQSQASATSNLDDSDNQESQGNENSGSDEQYVSVPEPVQEPAPAPVPAPSTGGGGYDGYTGCRAYGGNYALTSIDEKGRPYAKIDCVTRAQIG